MKIELKPKQFRANELLKFLRKRRAKNEFLQAFCVDKGLSVVNNNGYEYAEQMYHTMMAGRIDHDLFLSAFDFRKSFHGREYWLEHYKAWSDHIIRFRRNLEEKGEKMIITWPDSQNLSERKGFWSNCKLIVDLDGLDRYGNGAYLVDREWYMSEVELMGLGEEIPDMTEDVNCDWRDYEEESVMP